MSKFFRGLKNASYLAIGNLVTQIIGFIGFIYIAKMLGPNDYGIYTTVGAFVGIFTLLTFNGLNKVILREGSKDTSLMHKTLEKTIGVRNVFIIIAILFCIVSSFFTSYDLQVKLYIALFSIDLAYEGIKGFLATIYQASEKMQYPALFNISNRVITTSFSITFLYFGYGLLSLFLIQLISHIFILMINYRFSKRFVNFNFFSKPVIDKTLIKAAMIFSLLAFMNTLTSKIDLIMISFLGTSEDVGIYGVPYRIARQGVMLRNVTAVAFFPVFVKSFEEKAILGSRLIRYSILFFCSIFAISVGIYFYAEEIIVFIFGSEYEDSGEILAILVFYLCFWWATLPFTTAAQATHNEKVVLIAVSIMACINVPLNYIFFVWYGLIGIAYSTLVVYSIGSMMMCAVTYMSMKKQKYLL